MAPQVIREALDARPFKPFKVRMPDGAEVLIPAADHAQLTPSGRRLIVFSDDDRMTVLDPMLLPSLEMEIPHPS